MGGLYLLSIGLLPKVVVQPCAGSDLRRGAAMAEFLQLFVNGLAVGCIYGLVALEFVLIYKAGEVVNFAQGEFVMSAPSSRSRSWFSLV